MPEEKTSYKSFIFRICGDEAQQVKWITMARINKEEKTHYFTDLDNLVIFLLQEVGSPFNRGYSGDLL
jgi:hypothetical protein